MSQDVRDLLDEAVRQVPRRPGDLDAVKQRARRRQRRQHLALAGVAAVVVLVGALVVVPTLRNPTSPVIGPPGEATEVSVGELEVAVSSAIAALTEAPGVEGVQRAFIDGHLASATWFTSRSNGDVAVVQSVDVDVLDSGWWLGDAEPPATGRNIAVSAWILVDGVLYEATATSGQPDQPWSVSERQPPAWLAWGLAVLDAGTDLMATPRDGWQATRQDLEDGQRLWALLASYQDGYVVQRWEIGAEGQLASWEFELIDVMRHPLQGVSEVINAASIDYTALTDPDPLTPPRPGTFLNLADFDLPDGFPVEPN